MSQDRIVIYGQRLIGVVLLLAISVALYTLISPVSHARSNIELSERSTHLNGGPQGARNLVSPSLILPFSLHSISTGASSSTSTMPTNVQATGGDGEATVTWNVPELESGIDISLYSVVSEPAAITSTSTGTTTIITGLSNGTTYTFTVSATSSDGNEILVGVSNSTTPATVPDAPSNVSAIGEDAKVTVRWDIPISDGGSPITLYVVSSELLENSVTTTETTIDIGDLLNGATYTFVIAARNKIGLGTTSSESIPVTLSAPPTATPAPTATPEPTATAFPPTPTPAPTPAPTATPEPTATAVPPTVPDAPTDVTATGGDTFSVVSWRPPASDGGTPILLYTVVSSPSDISTTTSETTANIAGLINGTPYTFTVTAANSVGHGTQSSPSHAIIVGAVDLVAVDDEIQMDEDTGPITIDVLKNDQYATEALVLTVLADANSIQQGNVRILDGSSISYTPPPDYSGTDSFFYSLAQGERTVDATVNLTILAVDDVPVLLPAVTRLEMGNAIEILRTSKGAGTVVIEIRAKGEFVKELTLATDADNDQLELEFTIDSQTGAGGLTVAATSSGADWIFSATGDGFSENTIVELGFDVSDGHTSVRGNLITVIDEASGGFSWIIFVVIPLSLGLLLVVGVFFFARGGGGSSGRFAPASSNPLSRALTDLASYTRTNQWRVRTFPNKYDAAAFIMDELVTQAGGGPISSGMPVSARARGVADLAPLHEKLETEVHTLRASTQQHGVDERRHRAAADQAALDREQADILASDSLADAEKEELRRKGIANQIANGEKRLDEMKDEAREIRKNIDSLSMVSQKRILENDIKLEGQRQRGLNAFVDWVSSELDSSQFEPDLKDSIAISRQIDIETIEKSIEEADPQGFSLRTVSGGPYARRLLILPWARNAEDVENALRALARSFALMFLGSKPFDLTGNDAKLSASLTGVVEKLEQLELERGQAVPIGGLATHYRNLLMRLVQLFAIAELDEPDGQVIEVDGSDVIEGAIAGVNAFLGRSSSYRSPDVEDLTQAQGYAIESPTDVLYDWLYSGEDPAGEDEIALEVSLRSLTELRRRLGTSLDRSDQATLDVISNSIASGRSRGEEIGFALIADVTHRFFDPDGLASFIEPEMNDDEETE